MSFCDEDNNYGDCIVVGGRLASIDEVTSHVHAFAARAGVDAALERRLVLVLEELVTNTVHHGHPEAEGPIAVSLRCDDGRVRFRYRDRGVPFDPNHDLPPPDLHRPVTERTVGGLGWPLIWHYCEEVWYRRERDTNCLEFTLARIETG